MHHWAKLCSKNLLENKNQREVFVNIYCYSLGSENFEIGRFRDPANSKVLLFFLQAWLPLSQLFFEDFWFEEGSTTSCQWPHSALVFLKFSGLVNNAFLPADRGCFGHAGLHEQQCTTDCGKPAVPRKGLTGLGAQEAAPPGGPVALRDSTETHLQDSG